MVFQAAIRVITAHANDETPAPDDVQYVRRNALAEEFDLPALHVASRIAWRLLEMEKTSST